MAVVTNYITTEEAALEWAAFFVSWLSFILRGKSSAQMVWCIEVESICAGKPASHSLNAFILPRIGLY